MRAWRSRGRGGPRTRRPWPIVSSGFRKSSTTLREAGAPHPLDLADPDRHPKASSAGVGVDLDVLGRGSISASAGRRVPSHPPFTFVYTVTPRAWRPRPEWQQSGLADPSAPHSSS